MRLRNQAKALALLDRAKAAHRAGGATQALHLVRESIELNPDDIQALLLTAEIELSLVRTSDAMLTLDRASLHEHGHAHQLTTSLLRAKALTALGRHDQAMAILNQLITLCPGDASLHHLAASANEQAGHVDDAIAHLQIALKIDPADATTARLLARLLASRDPQASIYIMQQDSTKISSALQWQNAQWMHSAGRKRDAEETYRQLLKQNPDDGSLWIEAAEHADSCGSFSVAVDRYEHAFHLRKGDRAAACQGLARTFMHAGRFAQATWWWWKATKISEDVVEAWAGLIVSAYGCERAHLVELAQQRFEQIADEDQRTFELAQSWLEAGAGEVIARITQPEKPTAITASPMTWILQQSTQVLSSQVVRRPGWADTLYHTAICEAALGETDAASEHVQAALDINPNYKAATTLAARLPKAA